MSAALLAILIAIAVIVAPFAALRMASRWRAPQPLPEDWARRLLATVPQAVAVPAARRTFYLAQCEQFLRDKRFVGCNGLVVSDEMRLAVTGLACLLVLRPDAAPYPRLRSVLLYPGAFLVPQDEPDELGLVDDAPVEQIGESWDGERVLLSWPDVEAALAGDEVNVVVHEFAHQLDDETPGVEGAPTLRNYERWSEVMQREYARLRRHRRPPVLDPYGAESPGEFFGVVTEAYLQRGADLQRHHTELYGLLHDYYGLDTAACVMWPDADR